MPFLPITSPETIKKCASLPLRETDIFICSYPKSGTTWLQHVVLSLLISHLEKNSVYVPPYSHVSVYAPFFEIDPHWDDAGELAPSIRENHALIGRRIFNTHLRFDMLPETGKGGKFIYIVRSPLDACVSFYYHLSHQVEGGFEGSFDDFFCDWLSGDIVYGAWDDHISSYAGAFANTCGMRAKLDDGREFLFLCYEEMIADLPKVVDVLTKFLGFDIPREIQTNLLPTFSFAHMKASIDRFQPKSVQWKHQFSFLRRGRTGDRRSEITVEQQMECFRRFERILTKALNTNSDVLQKIIPLLRR